MEQVTLNALSEKIKLLEQEQKSMAEIQQQQLCTMQRLCDLNNLSEYTSLSEQLSFFQRQLFNECHGMNIQLKKIFSLMEAHCE